jgi:hypothetical protein
VVIGEFETDLVIALAGGAVGDGVRPSASGDFHLFLGDQRAGDGGAEEIAAFVDGIGAEHGEDEIADELFAQVFDIAFAGAGFAGLFRNAVQFLAWPTSAAKAYDLAAVFFDEPTQDDGGVQALRNRPVSAFLTAPFFDMESTPCSI